MRTVPALILTLASLSLAADTTGRITGKITNKAGQAVTNAKVQLKREDISWVKELKVSSTGTYMQVGLDPKDYVLTVTAEGYAPYSERVKIPLGDLLTKHIVLLTPQESGGTAAPVEDPGAALENAGSDAFNQAVELYNDKKYTEALPLVTLAYQNLTESLEKTKDDKAKGEIQQKLDIVGRTYAFSLFEVGIASESRKELLNKAKPILEEHLAKAPKEKPDTRAIDALHRIAKAQGDKEGEKKYQGMIEAIVGPQPEIPYNEAAEAINRGDMAKAKAAALRAIAVDAKYADAYYALGIAEFGLGNNAGAKTNFRKYLELAPTGKKAGEVKEMLRELK